MPRYIDMNTEDGTQIPRDSDLELELEEEEHPQDRCSLGDDVENVKEVYKEFEKFDFEHNQIFQDGWSSLSSIIDPSKVGVEYLKAKVFFFSKYHKSVNLEKYLAWKKAALDNSKAATSTDQNAHGEGQDSKERNPQQSDNDIVTNRSVGSRQFQNSDKLDECTKVHSPSNDAHSTSLNTDNCDSTATLLQSISLDTEKDIKEKDTDPAENEKKCSVEDRKDKSDIPVSDPDFKEEESSLSLLEVASYIQNGLPIPGLVPFEVQPTNQDPTPSSHERKSKPWETLSS